MSFSTPLQETKLSRFTVSFHKVLKWVGIILFPQIKTSLFVWLTSSDRRRLIEERFSSLFLQKILTKRLNAINLNNRFPNLRKWSLT
jgi:hypothetical protein